MTKQQQNNLEHSKDFQMVSKETFSKEVDDFIIETNSDVMSAIIKVAENKKIEFETISKFVNSNLKTRLEAEALSLRLIEAKAKLPYDVA